MKTYWKVCSKNSSSTRTIVASCDIVSAERTAEKGTCQWLWTERNGSSICGAEGKGRIFFWCPQWRQIPSRGSRLERQTQEEILWAMEKERAKTDSNQKKKQKGKGEDPVLSLKREDTRKETEKGYIKGSGPQGTSPPGKSSMRVCYNFEKRAMSKGIRMRILAPTRRFTLHTQKWMHVERYHCGEEGVGSLGWCVGHCCPQLSFQLAELPQKQASPTVQDLLKLNKVIRAAKVIESKIKIRSTIFAKIITVLTRYRLSILELI